jgi:hypothetical protein
MPSWDDLTLAYSKAKFDWENKRISWYKKFRSIFNNNYEEVINIIKSHYEVLYAKDAFKHKIFRHVDITEDIITRSTSGIYEKEPIRQLVKTPPDRVSGTEQVNDENLPIVLKTVDFHSKMTAAADRAIFFNIVIPYFVIRKDRTLDIQLLTPEMYTVKTKADYNKLEAIKITVWDGNETYNIIWSDKDMYGEDHNGKQFYLSENNKEGKNPYGVIPVVVFRIKEGTDFYGEPNWAIYDAQLAHDLQLSNLQEVEIFMGSPVAIAVNTQKEAEELLIGPNAVVTINGVREGEVAPSLDFVNPNADMQSLRDNIDFNIDNLKQSKGIVGSTASKDRTVESGAAKEIDLLPVLERRNKLRNLIKEKLELPCLEMLRKVWNYGVNNDLLDGELLDENATFEVVMQETKSFESIDDKIKIRKMQKEYGIKDEVDFMMEDTGCTEKEALAEIKKRRGRAQEVGQPMQEQQSIVKQKLAQRQANQ